MNGKERYIRMSPILMDLKVTIFLKKKEIKTNYELQRYQKQQSYSDLCSHLGFKGQIVVCQLDDKMDSMKLENRAGDIWSEMEKNCMTNST